MRNTLLKKYFSYFIILINNKLSKNNENMRNENEKSGSSSNLVVNSLSLYFQVNNYPFLLTFIRKYRH